MLEEPGLPLKLKSAAVGSMERQQHGAAASSSTAADSQHILKILVASDMHLGYGERDPVRGDDSFVTFREVFELALQHEADMVLLAGDLFHDNKPSRKALHKCMEIMRDHVFGERKVGIEVVSDQSANFHTKCAQQLHSRCCRACTPPILTSASALPPQVQHGQFRGPKLQRPAPRLLDPRQPRRPGGRRRPRRARPDEHRQPHQLLWPVRQL